MLLQSGNRVTQEIHAHMRVLYTFTSCDENNLIHVCCFNDSLFLDNSLNLQKNLNLYTKMTNAIHVYESDQVVKLFLESGQCYQFIHVVFVSLFY